ncbi:MAG TPA: S53 family peptidase [Kofleriaceae bacterium]|nr:S53 family peptidase [Kofleriaceae bacterium]
MKRLLVVLSIGWSVTACMDVEDGDSPDTDTLEKPVNSHAAVCPGPAGAGSARCHARVIVDGTGQPLATGGPSGFGPADLRDAYGISGSGSSSTTIAIVDAYGYANAEADLAVYRAEFGLPPCTTANGCFKKVNQNGVQGSYPKENTGWAQESALDLDMASAMCPNCKLILVQATSNSFGNLAAAVDTAAALGAHVISNSYGGGESGSASYESHYDHPGVAITASSGDGGYGVEFPAASPHVIAVGGTHLVMDGSARGWTETTWTGAGSGCSTVYAKPSWQHDTGCAKRTVADVSAVADPYTGVAVYGPTRRTRSGWMVFGGTSVSAPLIGGVYGVNGGSVNYGSDPYAHTSALFDVTAGSNGNCGGSYLCTAGAGYDGPTGLGTPNGSNAF